MSNFDRLTEADKERVMEIVARFHYRNSAIHTDGSFGTIEITCKEFNNVLAEIIEGIDIKKLTDKLTESFAQMEYYRDLPTPDYSSMLSKPWVYKYKTDAYFHNKVQAIVAGTINIIKKNII